MISETDPPELRNQYVKVVRMQPLPARSATP
jgi:hypothetical protein